MSDRGNKELAEQLVENIYAFGVDVHIIERTLNTATKELEQLRTENERLKKALSRIEAVYFLNPPHINQAKAMGIIALDALKEPDNDE